MSNSIAIAHIIIHQDAEGRYCLNDLHKASGGANRHRPSLFLRHKKTNEVVAELISEQEIRNPKALISALGFPESEHEFVLRKIQPIVTVAVGRPMTFVVKELVYAYAMWISPKFHLQVIRTYDALANESLENLTKPFTQSENYWFRIRPHWLSIRDLVLQGKPYGEVATLLQRSVGSVRRAVKRMVEVGLINPAALAQVQIGIAKFHNLKRSVLWGAQLHLFS